METALAKMVKYGGDRMLLTSESPPNHQSGVSRQEAHMIVPRSKPIPRTCEQCLGTFFICKARADNGRGTYCSMACRMAARNAKITKNCAQCGNPFQCHPRENEQRFCTRRCFYDSKRVSITLTCTRCGIEYQALPSQPNRTLCRQTCARPLLPDPSSPDTMLVPLSQGLFAVIDREDAEVIGKHNWFVITSEYGRYAGTMVKKRTVRLHQFILTCEPGFIPDHIDGDGLNNRRSNLRQATPTQNTQNCGKRKSNTTGFKGVTIHRGTGKYYASIGKTESIFLGSFDDAISAARAYDDAARRIHGEFARLNFPNEGERSA